MRAFLSLTAVALLVSGCGEKTTVVVPDSLTSAPAQKQETTVDSIKKIEYPASTLSYKEVDAAVGCKSKFSEDKQEDLFRDQYGWHWYDWSGTVVLPESGSTSLNIDGRGTQDLQVSFADPKAGYDLIEDQHITIRFLLTSPGGCFLPFSGEYAVILK